VLRFRPILGEPESMAALDARIIPELGCGPMISVDFIMNFFPNRTKASKTHRAHVRTGPGFPHFLC